MPMLHIEGGLMWIYKVNLWACPLGPKARLYRMGGAIPPSSVSQGCFRADFHHLGQTGSRRSGVFPLSGKCNLVDKYSYFVSFLNIESNFRILENSISEIVNPLPSGLLIEKRELSVIWLASAPYRRSRSAKGGSLCAEPRNSNLEFSSG